MPRLCRGCGNPTGRVPRAVWCEPCLKDTRAERERQRGRGRYKTLTEEQRKRRRAYANEHARRRRLADPEKVKAESNASHKRRYDKGAEILRAAKRRPCADCGVQLPPAAMEFDHVRGVKSFAVSLWFTVRLPKGVDRFDALADEIAKCDVRCPNCHRMRHLRERGEA